MRIKVHQINMELDRNRVKFVSYDSALKHAGRIDPSIYKTVFDGNVDCKNLEDVYQLFSFDHPVTHQGHSLSVSDVVEVCDSYEHCSMGKYYCDTVGFHPLTEFDSAKCQPIKGHRMVIVEPGKPAYEGIIGEGLEALQRAVRGMIECTYPFEDNAFVIGNEEAKLEKLPGNRRIGGSIYAGNILIAADDGCGGTTDLTDEQVEKYTAMFASPEEISDEEVAADCWFTITGYDN